MNKELGKQREKEKSHDELQKLVKEQSETIDLLKDEARESYKRDARTTFTEELGKSQMVRSSVLLS